jgi:hypothetical protein
MSTATLQPEAEIRRDDLRLAELVGFLSGYPTLDALEVIQANDDPDPLARVARALVRINRLHRRNGVLTTTR